MFFASPPSEGDCRWIARRVRRAGGRCEKNWRFRGAVEVQVSHAVIGALPGLGIPLVQQVAF
jgi:plasmid replication initiation protein